MSSDLETYKHYCCSIIECLKERAFEAHEDGKKNKGKDDFKSGRAFAYYEVISLLQLDAIGFQVDLKTIGLDDIDPDKDLLF